jgi:hypothetical protein
MHPTFIPNSFIDYYPTGIICYLRFEMMTGNDIVSPNWMQRISLFLKPPKFLGLF